MNCINALSTNPTKWSNTLQQLFECIWPFCGVIAFRVTVFSTKIFAKTFDEVDIYIQLTTIMYDKKCSSISLSAYLITVKILLSVSSIVMIYYSTITPIDSHH